MNNEQELRETIGDSVNTAVQEGKTRIEIDRSLTNLILKCVDLKIDLPQKTHNKYIVERLNHVLELLKDGDTVNEDINELINELTPEYVDYN